MRALVDSIRCAAFLVDDRGRVVTANAVGTAMLRDARLLTYEGGRLAFPDRIVNHRFQTALRGVMNGTTGGPIHLATPSPSTPLAFVLPRTGAAGGRRTEAVVVVPPPNEGGELVKKWLRTTHGLSRAEADVAVEVAAGHELRDIAESRQVALGTVRNQVKRAMSKMGVHRRSQLVAVVVATAGPLGSLLGRWQRE